MNNYILSDIEWDDEGQGPDACGLPSTVLVVSNLPLNEEELSENLSNVFGFCHYGFQTDSYVEYLRRSSDAASGGLYPEKLAVIILQDSYVVK